MKFFTKILPLALALIASPSFADNVHYIDGIQNPEDFAQFNSRYLFASGMSPKSGLHLIDTKTKTAQTLTFKIAQNPQFGDCDTAPNADELQAHGISFNKNNGLLYVVNHGGSQPVSDLANGGERETIEIFSVKNQQSKPILTWQGCVKMPNNAVANGVVADNKGTIYATVALHKGDTAMDFFGTRPTGAVYRWTAKTGFEKMTGTERVGNNGIEISPDGKHLYVVHMQNVSKFTATIPAKTVATQKIGIGLGDNIRWNGNRLILGASRLENCPATGADFSCMKGYHISAVNPNTLKIKTLLTGENTEQFGGVSVAYPMNGLVWLGSFQGNKVAYRAFK